MASSFSLQDRPAAAPTPLRPHAPRTAHRRHAIAAALLLSLALEAPAAAADGWADGFGWPGVEGTIYSIATFRGEIVVGGEFTAIGGTPAGFIARWDGVAWRSLGAGLFQSNVSLRGVVVAMTVYDDELVVVGSFDRAGGVPVSNVARWDGTAWHAMGFGFDDGAQAVGVYQGTLIAGGAFTSADLQPAAHMAAWDGSAWSALPGGGLDGVPQAFAVYGGELVAAGTFTQAGGVAVSNIAAWDGSAWRALGGGLTGGIQGTVADLAVFGDSLVAGGWFTHAGGTPAMGIAAWNGATWSALGAGVDSRAYGLAVFEGRLVAGGDFASAGGQPAEAIATWDGAAWAPLPSRSGRTQSTTSPPVYLSLAAHDTLLVAAGFFDMTPDVMAVNLAAWDGTGWLPFGAGLSDNYYVSWVSCFAEFDGRLIVGGRLAHRQTSALSSVDLRAWDGIWMNVFEPFVSSSVETPDVAALIVYQGDLVAAGSFTEIGGVPANYVARWDGQVWSPLGTGTDGPVDALAIHDGELIAGGVFAVAGGTAAPNVARWDGTSWSPLGAGTNDAVDVLLVYRGELIAGGLFTVAGGAQANHVARWNGSGWGPLGSGTDDWVRSAVVHDDALFVGGRFTHAGGIAAHRVARWNGSSWSALGSGLDDQVSAVGSFGSDVVVGGRFMVAGNVPARHIARWDGSAWSALGDGLDAVGSPLLANVLAFHAAGDELHIGGHFNTAGGRPSYNIARWDGARAATPPVELSLAPSVPNPFSTSTRFRFGLPSAGSVRLDIYDLGGRHVIRLAEGQMPAGEQEITWDGTDAAGGRVRMGIYFVRLEALGATRARKVVLAR